MLDGTTKRGINISSQPAQEWLGGEKALAQGRINLPRSILVMKFLLVQEACWMSEATKKLLTITDTFFIRVG